MIDIKIPCNCFHLMDDHKDLGEGEIPFITWCRYSEDGLCPCDYFVPMTNLEYLQYKYDQKHTDTK